MKVEDAFPRALADEARDILWRDTGFVSGDPTTWVKPVVRLGFYSQPPFVAAANTATLRSAFDRLVGVGRWWPRGDLGTFAVRFPLAADAEDMGWHVDPSTAGDSPASWAQPPLHPASGKLQLTRENGDYAPVEIAIRSALP